MDTLEMRTILQDMPSGKKLCKSPDHLNSALFELMGRYGTMKSEVLEHSDGDQQIDHTQTAATDTGDAVTAVFPDKKKEEQLVCDMVVRLRLERVRGIGNVDMFGGADLFCVAFIGDWRSGQGISGAIHGNRLFQTRVLRGRSESEWTWNEVAYSKNDLQIYSFIVDSESGQSNNI